MLYISLCIQAPLQQLGLGDLRKLSWLSVPDSHDFQVATSFKVWNGLAPQYLMIYFNLTIQESEETVAWIIIMQMILQNLKLLVHLRLSKCRTHSPCPLNETRYPTSKTIGHIISPFAAEEIKKKWHEGIKFILPLQADFRCKMGV